MAPTIPTNVIDLADDSDGSLNFADFLSQDDAEIGERVHGLHIGRNVQVPRLGSDDIDDVIDHYPKTLTRILDVFPDISHSHVQELYNRNVAATGVYREETLSQLLIEKILDGGAYPKERDSKKRKFSEQDSDDEEAAKWKYANMRDDPTQYQDVAKVALQEAFPFVPVKYIQTVLNKHRIFYGAYFEILEAGSRLDSPNPPFAPIKARRGTKVSRGSAAMMAELTQQGFDFDNLKKEIDSALQRRKKDEAKRQATKDAKLAEESMEQELRARGDVMECQCCFGDYTTPKMTQCNGDEPHLFCFDCARSNANNDIGNSRYELRCMDQSGCKATFSRQERTRFLDSKTIEKLERIQQQEDIRMANLPNLSTCPFCDFAAICPPIEEDREFRCHNPDCEEVSCRLCKAKSHIPLSCEEFQKENGMSERRVIEEARTEALIRTCGKCKVRILKEQGCNKVICTSCYAVLCDYCGKDISKAMYNHFDGQGQAPPGVITNGPGAKCPLYDGSDKRKDRQVDEAEKEAMAKVRAEHPNLSEDDLKIKFSKSVQASAKRPSWEHHHHHREMDFDFNQFLDDDEGRIRDAARLRNGLAIPAMPPPPPHLMPIHRRGIIPDAEQGQAEFLQRRAQHQAELAQQEIRQREQDRQVQINSQQVRERNRLIQEARDQARQARESARQAGQQARQIRQQQQQQAAFHQQREILLQRQLNAFEQQQDASFHNTAMLQDPFEENGPFQGMFIQRVPFANNGVFRANGLYGGNNAFPANETGGAGNSDFGHPPLLQVPPRPDFREAARQLNERRQRRVEANYVDLEPPTPPRPHHHERANSDLLGNPWVNGPGLNDQPARENQGYW